MATYTSATSTKVSGTIFNSDVNGSVITVPANSYALFNWHLSKTGSGTNFITVGGSPIATAGFSSTELPNQSGQGVAGPGQTIVIQKSVAGNASVSGFILTNSF